MQIGTMGGIGVHFDIRLEIDAGRLEPFPTLLLLDRRPDVFLARRSGVTGWLLKPLDPIRLRRATTALLGVGRTSTRVSADAGGRPGEYGALFVALVGSPPPGYVNIT